MLLNFVLVKKKKENCPDDYIFFFMKDVLTIKNTKKPKKVQVSSNVSEVNKTVYIVLF